MHSSRHINSPVRGRIARGTVVLALALPAGAFAASTDPEPRAPVPSEEPSPVALVAGYGAGLVTEAPAEPKVFHPVVGPVDYGDALASFGNERGRPHEGQDIFAPAGTKLVSPLETTVLETGADGGRGNWAALYDASADRTFVYFHMLEPASVEAGQKLTPGDPVGVVGCTGSCYGDHLHFEIRDGRDPYGTATDPLPELMRWEKAAKS